MLNKRNRIISKCITYILLVCFSIYCIFPFVWMVISASNKTLWKFSKVGE